MWQFRCCKHALGSFNQSAILLFWHPILFMCIRHNILSRYAMVFTKFDKMARCIFTSIVRSQTFDFISCLSFNKGFVKLKHWKHIRFYLEEINCSEPWVVIYECCKVDRSIERFCLHGTTNVKCMNSSATLARELSPLENGILCCLPIMHPSQSGKLYIGNYSEFRLSYLFSSFHAWHECVNDPSGKAI
jgi:hypothetical protein